MSLLTGKTSIVLWQDVIRRAENFCSISLKEELEAYLVTLLMRYTTRPEIVKQIIATRFLEGLQLRDYERSVSLQNIGDQCLLLSGLFPHVAEKKHVKIAYFVDVGRTAYSTISKGANDLYSLLALHFVILMDVLQSLRQYSRECPDLLPIEAYDQWNEVGSQRALKILRAYSQAVPMKRIKS